MRKRIALIFISHHDLTGGGGAERFLTQSFDSYKKKKNAEFNLYFITDDYTYRNLRSIGKLKTQDGIIRIKNEKNVIFNEIFFQLRITKLLIKLKFDIIHIWMPSSRYLPFLFLINQLKRKIKSKLVINIVDCSLAHYFLSKNKIDRYGQLCHYQRYFKYLQIDGILSFYKLFERLIKENLIPLKNTPITASLLSCFTDIDHFRPAIEKEKLIVYVGRLVAPKRPSLFIDAIGIANKIDPKTIAGWRFIIFGKGPLEKYIQQKIKKLHLSDLISLDCHPDMASVLSKSKLYISTQEYENFTSQSLLEAMATGNAIIAQNVGQTSMLVVHQKNGYLLGEGNPKELGLTLLKYMNDVESQIKMQNESRRIVTEVHTVDKFLSELQSFWKSVDSFSG